MNVIELPRQWLPAVQQEIFRHLLQAMAYPGDRQDLSELVPEGAVAVSVLGTLIDEEVTFADPHRLISEVDHGFLLGRSDMPDAADYILVAADQSPTFRAKNGDIYRPEHAATVIISCQDLANGETQWMLTGPGIETITTLRGNLDLAKWLDWRDELTLYPQGVDLILCDATGLVAIPRTTIITPAKGDQ